jgi:hypothetical protein
MDNYSIASLASGARPNGWLGAKAAGAVGGLADWLAATAQRRAQLPHRWTRHRPVVPHEGPVFRRPRNPVGTEPRLPFLRPCADKNGHRSPNKKVGQCGIGLLACPAGVLAHETVKLRSRRAIRCGQVLQFWLLLCSCRLPLFHRMRGRPRVSRTAPSFIKYCGFRLAKYELLHRLRDGRFRFTAGLTSDVLP